VVVGRTVVPPVPSARLLGRLLRPLAEVQPQAADGPPPLTGSSRELQPYRVEEAP
jgi:hypothetical protein